MLRLFVRAYKTTLHADFTFSLIPYGIFGTSITSMFTFMPNYFELHTLFIPDGVIEISYLINPSGRTMALGSTQPLTEMSSRGIS